MCKRQLRISEFDKFYQESENLFEKMLETDASAKRLESLYSFYIVPGGRADGSNKRVIEIFFGSRPIDSVTSISIH